MKGTHFPKTKKQMSDLEIELVTKLLEINHPLTSRNVSEFLNWDIRQTTATLSNLVGMDLCLETDQNPKLTNVETHEFSSQEPIYEIPENTVYHKRALYARDRKRGTGYTLWHLLHKDTDYGENLWPFRPVDRIKITGKILEVNGNLLVDFFSMPKELNEMIGKEVTITIQS